MRVIKMSKSNQDELYELNMQRETWCRVEATRLWNLPERKHFRCHLRDTCDFSALQTVRPEERSAWMMKSGTNRRLPERRHFEDSYNTHLV